VYGIEAPQVHRRYLINADQQACAVKR